VRPELYAYVRWSLQACPQKNPGVTTVVKLPWSRGYTCDALLVAIVEETLQLVLVLCRDCFGGAA